MTATNDSSYGNSHQSKLHVSICTSMCLSKKAHAAGNHEPSRTQFACRLCGPRRLLLLAIMLPVPRIRGAGLTPLYYFTAS